MIKNQQNSITPTQNRAQTDNFNENSPKSASNGDFSAQNQAEPRQNKQFSSENQTEIEQSHDKFPSQASAQNTKTSDPVSVIQENSENFNENSPPKDAVLSQNDDDALFSALFPGMTREKAENDEIFKLFMRSRRDKAPLSLAYSEYKALQDKIEEQVLAKEAARLANKQSSVGSLTSSEPTDNGFFTKEQVLKMSREQISKNYDKIRQSQSKW